MRVVLGIEYDGSQFHGWQSQPGLRTVQSELETALSVVANESINTVCAGRTDTGVHALEQIVHFDTQAERDEKAWVYGVNANLPNDIVVRWAQYLDEKFHARFSAIARTYCYVINTSQTSPCIYRHCETWYPHSLNASRMEEAAQSLLGEHDFSSFRAADCQSKSPNRFIHHIKVEQFDHRIMIEIKANAFLHHMVRNIVGVLVAVGTGKQPIHWIQQVLDAKQRTAADVTMPPNGLFLMRVHYPDTILIPQDTKVIPHLERQIKH